MFRSIVHLDADAFFVSVEQAADQKLRGKAVAVGGQMRGVIASASYEARKFGISSGMPTSKARKLCPKLIIIPSDFEKYEQFSRWMFSYIYDFTPNVEVGSIDEGYFDLTSTRKPAEEIAGTIQKAILQSLKINVSEAVGSNKLVTAIASKMNKPSAFVRVPEGQERSFLATLANQWLPGIGPKVSRTLNTAGLVRIGQIAETPTDVLSILVGAYARQLKTYSLGVDDRPVIAESMPAKSYSHQETFNQDTTDEEFISSTCKRMADSLMRKIREDGKSIRTVAVKVRYNDMDEESRTETLLEPTDLETEVYGTISRLIKKAWSRRVSLRLVSLKLSNVYDFSSRIELPLDDSRRVEARHRLAQAADMLRQSLGRQVLFRGHDFLFQKQSNGMSRSDPVKIQESHKRCYLPAQGLGLKGVIKRKVEYVPLAVHSFYSFLDSALSIEAITKLAVEQGMSAIGLADTNNLHGAVEFFERTRDVGIKPILGAEIQWQQMKLWLYVKDAIGHRNLCRIVTRHSKATSPQQLLSDTTGLIAIAADGGLSDLFPCGFYLRATPGKPAISQEKEAVLLPVRYGRPTDRSQFDVLQSIRTRTLLRQSHSGKDLSAQFHLRTSEEVAELFSENLAALKSTLEIAEQCTFRIDQCKPQFPSFLPPDGSTTTEFLRKLVLLGLRERYGDKADALRNQCEQELSIIRAVGYEEYFLTVWDLLQDCKQLGIEWITRGSAADSLVCYCLRISDVCPIRFDLYFRRFLNVERMSMNKLPDIDIDFPYDRKDDVVGLVFKKYGHQYVAVVGGFSTFQARSAFADAAKTLGVSEFQVRRITERIPHQMSPDTINTVAADAVELRDLPLHEDPYATALKMAAFLDGFPRYPKMHPCGVVISREPMEDITACFVSHKGFPTTHDDMEAVEYKGLVKLDILAQGGLAVIRDSLKALLARGIQIGLTRLEPWSDPLVWTMIANMGARAVHHIESPGMVTLCSMTQVHEMDTLVGIVSVVRPGASNQNAKLEFTRRYQGFSPITYAHPSIEPCLRCSFGLIIYEEQVLQICELFAGLSGGKADVLRRALGKEKEATIREIEVEFKTVARGKGRSEEDIHRVWELIVSFRGYAFNKAHSTAYAVEAYQAAYLKCYYPTEFMACVLTHGKGFYQPLVYVLESYRLRIRFLRPNVQDPGPGFKAVGSSIRIPIHYIKGLTDKTKEQIVNERKRGPFSSVGDLYVRTGAGQEDVELLIRVGAFDSLGQTRTQQFWELKFILQGRDTDNASQGWLFPHEVDPRFVSLPLEEPSQRQRWVWEIDLLGFPAEDHPLTPYDQIDWDSYCRISQFQKYIGEEVTACGLIVEGRTVDQENGEIMKFLTIADRTGMIETELFGSAYKTYGSATVGHRLLEVTGKVEPFENNKGFSLRIIRAGKPRMKAVLSNIR